MSRRPETDSAIGALLRRNVDRIIAERGISTTDVRVRCRMTRAQYAALFKHQHGPRLTTLIRIAEALRISLSELLQEG